MSVLRMIKENRVLVAGLVLPLLLTGLMVFAKNLPQNMEDPPQYRFAYFAQNYSGYGSFSVKVDDTQHISAHFNKANNNGYAGTVDPKMTIYIFDGQTKKVTEYPFSLSPKDIKDGVTEIDISKLQNLSLSNQSSSPDGYSFESYHYRSHSLITEVFFDGYSSYGPSLRKNGTIIPLPSPTIYVGDITFLGWVMSGQVEGE